MALKLSPSVVEPAHRVHVPRRIMGKHFDAGLRALELDEGLPYSRRAPSSGVPVESSSVRSSS